MELKEPILYKCRGKCGQFKVESDFPRTGPYKGRYYRTSVCKECTNRRKWKLRRIPLSTIKPHLLEIVHRTGSQRAAAKAIGVKPTQLRHWLGVAYRYRPDGTKKKAHTISRTSAARILRTLHTLRLENTYYEHGNRKGKKPTWFRHDDRDAEYKRNKRKAS